MFHVPQAEDDGFDPRATLKLALMVCIILSLKRVNKTLTGVDMRKKRKEVEFSSHFVVALSYRYSSNHNIDPRPGFNGFGKTFDTHHKSKTFDEEGTYRMMTSEPVTL